MDTKQSRARVCTPEWWTIGLIVRAVGSVAVVVILHAAYVSNSGVISVRRSGGTVALTGVPGDIIGLHLLRARAVDGEWRSHDGVSLTLRGPEPAVEHVWRLVQPSYHDLCQSDDCSDTVSVRGSFKVPDPIGPEPQELSGRLSGGIQLQTPSKTFELDRPFDLPVTLKVVSRGEGTTSGATERDNAKKNVWTVMALNVASFAALWSFLLLRSGYIDVQWPGNQPLRLVGRPGDRIRLKLFAGNSTGGAWGTDSGLSMALSRRPDGRRTVIPVIDRRPLLGSGTEVSSFSVDGAITTPAYAGTYSGRLIGTVAYPFCKCKRAIARKSLCVPTVLEVDPNGVTSGQHGSVTWNVFRIGLFIDAVFVVWLLATFLE